VKVDLGLGAMDGAADAARAAEAAGYAGVFTGEVSSDPFLPLVLAAAATEHLQVGTGIAVAFARSPMTLAYTAYDLQRFSRGRFVLGLGSQVKPHIERRFDMPWGKPAAQMRDFIGALRAVWTSWDTGAPLGFESEHYRLTLMTPTFTPPRHDFGPPEVHVAGVGEVMTRVAGEVADGFVCHAFTTERWIRERTLPALAEGRARVGRTMEGFTVKAPIFLATGTDEEIQRAVDGIRVQVAFYASTPAYRPVLELHGWDDLGPELTRLSKEGAWQEMPALVDDEVLSAFAVIGSPAEAAAEIRRRCKGAVERVALLPAAPAEVLEVLRS
jgi:probable F420-dependent oxidoreductase